MKELSIHPRHHIHGKGQSVNTSKAHRPQGPRKHLRKARAALDRRTNAHAATLASLPATVPPTAFRKPGSMKGK